MPWGACRGAHGAFDGSVKFSQQLETVTSLLKHGQNDVGICRDASDKCNIDLQALELAVVINKLREARLASHT